jgi:PAS domain S-box-containing protein
VLVFHDVTEKRRAHRELQNVIDSISDGMLVLDRNWRFTYFSEPGARMIGMRREDLIGGCIWEIFPHAQGTAFYEEYRRAVETGQPVTFEEYYPEPIDKWFECHCYPSETGLSVYFHDITGRRRAEDALRESEEQFRTLANAIPQLCWMANADGWIFWYNRRWYEYTGTTPEQMEGWGWQSVHDPELLPQIIERWRASLSTGEPFDMVFPLRGADGVFRPFLTRVMPVRDREGKVVRWFGTNTDIGEQRRIEEALRQSESRLRTLTDNLPEGAIYRYRHDAQGEPHIDFISAGIERLTGVPAAEYMADHDTMYRNILPEDHGRLDAAIASSRERLEQFEVEVRHPHRATGEIRWSLLRSTPTRNPDGSIVWDGIELDITERRRAETRLAERTIQLERLAADLEERNLAVERANRMKTDFLARSSHELRTPLNAIVGYSELLGEQSAGPLPPPYPRFVANIQEGARHLLAMVNDLLDISRIEAGHIDLNRETFSPAGVLEEVLSVVAPLAAIKHIAIENAIPAGMSIRADRTRFKQVLFNLVSNAVKFTPENGRVWIADASRQDAAGFCVGDTGIGIPASELESVFDEFHQVGGPPNVAREGTGLGLAITRRLVELHGGTIGVESTVGQGSRFTVSLGAHSLDSSSMAF